MKIAEYIDGELVYRDPTEEETNAINNEEKPIKQINPIANAYEDTVMYKNGDLAQYNNEMYRFKLNRAKGIKPTNKKYWEKVSMTTIINELNEEK